MKNRRKVSAVAAAVALCAMFTTPAQAARGSFAYRLEASGQGWHLTDPEDGRCYPTQAPAHQPSNHTDRLAVLYRGTDCQDGAVVTFLEPGQTAPDRFGSVKFLVR
ncbi:hypothetical protein IAG44_38205 [Streptomyces roseirectus]|uniref:Secreted protein n=1 Tax=Streptomyces roseirectus TaxID=2768066 RepID=A0A7H0IPJ8_9ACTN|nr:hypothetical protein [Streptomyces roseirectus]QNP74714.1 hypothetical protein IAG44_38205 [Streptomyces roseirectus]